MRLKLLLVGIGLLILGFALGFVVCPSGGSCSNDAPSVVSGLLALSGIVTIPVSIILSLRDRGQVSGPSVASTSAAFLGDLMMRLTSAGFSVRRDFDVSPYRLDLLAGRTRFELSKGGELTRVVAVSRFDSANTAQVQEFSTRVTKYAFDNPQTLLPRGFGGVFVFPVLVSRDFDETVKNWITKTSPPKHWAATEFPVLVSTDQRRVYYCKKTPIWGAAYYRGLRKFAETMIGNSQPL